MLRVRECTVRYGSVAAVRGVSFELTAGEIVAVVGPNGAGKTSLFSAIAGLVPCEGSFELAGAEIGGFPAEQRAAAGLAFVPDGRRLFGRLSVEQNLLVGATPVRGRHAAVAAVQRVLERFPRLSERRAQRADTLSGGEGQALMIARALVAGPRVLLVDEPFQGLSEESIASVHEALRETAASDAAVVVASPEPIPGLDAIHLFAGALREVAR